VSEGRREEGERVNIYKGFVRLGKEVAEQMVCVWHWVAPGPSFPNTGPP